MYWEIEDVFRFYWYPCRIHESVPKPFCEKAKYDNGWAFSVVVQYLQNQKERVEIKEISAGTMKNYFQAIRLFCDMADIPIPWKKISRERKKIRRN
jgi:hypothetical protein